MEYITPINNYIVVEPTGNVVGFVELSDARSFISTVYLNRILSGSHEGRYSFFDMYQEKDQQDFGIMMGVYEGECQIYSIDDFIENIQNSAMFQDEKDELIGKLLKENINMNVNNYGLEEMLTDVEEKWTV